MQNFDREEIRQIVYSINMRLKSIESTIRSPSIDDKTKHILMQDVKTLRNLVSKLDGRGMNEGFDIHNLSQMITEDPDIHDNGPDLDSGSREYEAEEVPLARGVSGHVFYDYMVSKTGRYMRGTYESPPEYPDIDLTLVKVQILHAFDDYGNEVPVREEYNKAAEDYFYTNLKEDLIDNESNY